MGKNNKAAECKMGTNKLKVSIQERDLGVIIDKSGKSSEQCVLAVQKANSVLGMINKMYNSKVNRLL